MKKILSLFFFLILSYSSLFAVVKTSIASGNYNNPAIWSPAGVPGSFDDVVIATGHIVTFVGSITDRTTTIQSGATLNAGIYVNIWGITSYNNNGIHNGNITLNAAGTSGFDGSGILNGNINVSAGGPLFNTTCTITINGSIISTSTFSILYIRNQGNILLNGNISGPTGANSNITFDIGSSFVQIGNTTVYSHSFIYNNGGNYDLSGGDLYLNNSAIYYNGISASTSINNLFGSGIGLSYFFNDKGAIVKFGGNVFPSTNDGELLTSGISIFSGISAEPNTVEYNGMASQEIKSPSNAIAYGGTYLANTYSNLIISNTNIKSLSNNTTINGNLIIKDDARLDISHWMYSVDLKGNWIDTSTNADPFIERFGLVTFSGASAQTMSTNLAGGETFYILAINNTSTGVTQVNNNVNVSNVLTLTNGLVHTGMYEINVTNTALTSVNGYGTASYIDGYLKRNLLSTGGSYDFPVGNTTSYQLATVNLLGTHTVGNLLVNFSNLPAGTGLPLTEGSASYSTILNCGGTVPGTGNINDGVWTITPNSGTANYDVTLYGRNYSNAAAGNTILKRADASSAWSLLGSYVASTGSEPLIAKRTGYSGFSQFAIASSVIALPIELTSFTANCQANGVLLNWTTASEINNAYFTIERSTDAINFEPIGTKQGAGNSNSTQNYSFTDKLETRSQKPETVFYYRLKQTDYDGTSKTSKIISVAHCNLSTLIIYPNPATDFLYIKLDLKQNQNFTLVISDAMGNTIKKEENTSFGNVIFHFNISSIPKGVYYITVKSNQTTSTTKFIKQ